MKPELTPKQKRFFDYLEDEINKAGKSPSLRQAAADLGISHAAVSQLLKAIEEKGYIKRDGRYSRTIYILNQASETSGIQRWQEVPIIGQITAGLPMYAQQKWDGSIVVDRELYKENLLFALKIKGDSMKNAAILNGDLVICKPRQYAENGEIVAVLIHDEEATVKRFYLRKKYIELKPENPKYAPMRYGFSDVLVQGKVIGVQRVIGGTR